MPIVERYPPIEPRPEIERLLRTLFAFLHEAEYGAFGEPTVLGRYADAGLPATQFEFVNAHVRLFIAQAAPWGFGGVIGEALVSILVLGPDGRSPSFPPGPGQPFHWYDLSDVVLARTGKPMAEWLPPGHTTVAEEIAFLADMLKLHAAPLLTGTMSPEEEAELERIRGARA